MSDKNAELLERLRPESPVTDRLEAFAELGIRPAQLRRGIAVSPESLRLWAKGGPVRPSNRAVIDNIGRVTAILLDGLGSRERVVSWLTAPSESKLGSPLELIRDQPEAVLAAADAHVAGRLNQEREFLAQAAESRKRAYDLTAPDAVSEPTDLSSTQVKRLLLARLHEITADHTSAREAMEQLDARDKPGAERLPNYEAYKRFVDSVRDKLEDAGDAPAQTAISSLLARTSAEEESLRKEFEKQGAELISRDSKILTYSLSMRVIQALWGVADEDQATCGLYVAEGRVKSVPSSGELPAFADAAEILRFLASTRYDRFIVPDALAPSLIVAERVNLVMLGAQRVFVDSEGEPTHFVATAGTEAILRAARDADVRVSVFAEEEKFTDEAPEVIPRERVVSVSLPTEAGAPEGYARLLMISAELCNIQRGDPRAVGDPSIVSRPGRPVSV